MNSNRYSRRDGVAASKAGFVVSILAPCAALYAVSSTAQENVDTEDLPAQELTFGVPPAAHTQGMLTPLPDALRDELRGFFPSLTLGLQYHTNVRRTPGFEESDLAFVIAPELAYRTRFNGRHGGEIRYSANFLRYRDLDDEDVTNHSLDGALRFDLSPKLDVRLFGQYSDAQEERGASGTRTFTDEQPDEVEVLRYGGEIILGRPTQALQFAVGLTRSDWDYQNNDQQFRNRRNDRIHGILFYNLSPKTSLFLEANHTDIDYDDDAAGLDSEEDVYYLGARWRASATLDALFKIGDLEKEMSDPAFNDFDGTSYLGKLVWQMRPFSRIQILASRTTEESAQQSRGDPEAAAGELTDPYYVSRLIGLHWAHDLSTRWRLYAFFNHTEDDYPNDRDDTIKDLGIGLSYRFSRWLTVTAQYGDTERDSNDPAVEYEDQSFTLLLRSDFSLGGKTR